VLRTVAGVGFYDVLDDAGSGLWRHELHNLVRSFGNVNIQSAAVE
jgi:hypothetical protein